MRHIRAYITLCVVLRGWAIKCLVSGVDCGLTASKGGQAGAVPAAVGGFLQGSRGFARRETVGYRWTAVGCGGRGRAMADSGPLVTAFAVKMDFAEIVLTAPPPPFDPSDIHHSLDTLHHRGRRAHGEEAQSAGPVQLHQRPKAQQFHKQIRADMPSLRSRGCCFTTALCPPLPSRADLSVIQSRLPLTIQLYI